MSLNKLGLRYFRNIEAAELIFSDNFNIIYGDNGAGKTNILESIYYLSLARSFRTTQPRKLIQLNQDYLQVVGTKESVVLGIQKSVSGVQIKINGERIKQASRLTTLLPVQLIHPQSHELLEQGPKQRRQFLDWGVFHVEPTFLPLWHDYSHTLKQRNAALRQGQANNYIQLWDARLIDSGEKMTELRLAGLKKLQPHIDRYSLALIGQKIEAAYRPGWTRKQDFADALNNSLDQDKHYGFTRAGPHRADLVFTCKNNRVQDYLSRGQQKLLICALRFAQIKFLKEEKNEDVILLIDDLAAELDEQHRMKLIETALETGAQIFVTANQLNLLGMKNSIEHKVFHVEHGQVTEVVQ